MSILKHFLGALCLCLIVTGCNKLTNDSTNAPIATIDNKNTTINEPEQKVWFPRPHGGRTISGSGNLLDDTFIDPNNGWALFHIGQENRWELQRTFDGEKIGTL